MLRVALALLLVGCSGEASYVCSDLVFAEVHYSEPADCATSRAVTSAVKRVAQETGAWPNVDLKAVTLVVRPSNHFYTDVMSFQVDGAFTPGVIQVGANFEALLHECFHAKDFLEFDLPRLLAPLHSNWNNDGRDAAIRVWRSKLKGMGIRI